MPALCALLLEVFDPVSIYDDNPETIAWEVGSDPTHETPYLLAPRNYAEQEIDPIRCTATIGTVEVGVIDVPTIPGDQTSGWMTARVHDLLGRRCKLSRYIGADIGWIVIADGPAGPPRMDASYAAYRWSIRDTRETERKMTAFATGGVAGIAPRKPIYGFGEYTGDDDVVHKLLPSALELPITGQYRFNDVGENVYGYIAFDGHYSPATTPPTLDSADLIIGEDGAAAVELSEIATNQWAARYADVLWRLVGDTVWNVARPVMPTSYRQPAIGLNDALLGGIGDPVIALSYASLFVAPEIPEGFPTESELAAEVIVRYRGPASEAYPYYIEGALGDVLKRLYDGKYSLPPTDEIEGFIYDPGELDRPGIAFVPKIQYDQDALDRMVDHVMLRQVAPVQDTRAFAESMFYAPSGWIPALNSAMQISPISRNRPSSVDDLLQIDNAVAVPQPNWQTGDRTISRIGYTYPRYFIPAEDSEIEVKPDGLAERDVTIEFEDVASELRYGPQAETYDGSAFAAVGTPEGINRPGQLETASLMAQIAQFEVLDRYRAGVQSTTLTVRRLRVPGIRVGDWVYWALSHLPDRLTGVRGSIVQSAQVLSLRDDDCTWRSMLLEESPLSAGEPGYADPLEKVGEDFSPGYSTLGIVGDEESY